MTVIQAEGGQIKGNSTLNRAQQVTNCLSRAVVLCVICGVYWGSRLAQSAIAQTPPALADPVLAAPALADIQLPDNGALPVQLADLGEFPLFLPTTQGQVLASNSRVSTTQLSEPSLLWIQDQLGRRYGSDRLIEQWRAYRTFDDLQYVDVIVNESIWSLFNYFERYAFILQFGTVAKNYGYNLRVFHSGDVINRRARSGQFQLIAAPSAAMRGAYLCPFADVSTLSTTAADPTTPGPLVTSTTADLSCHIVLDESSQRPRQRPF